MRQIFLDVETTGLNSAAGDRIVEVAALEVINRRKTGQYFHRYLNPGRAIGSEAFKVHGLSDEFLRDKPCFADIYQELLAFIRGAELLIHNAIFDTAFLDYELALLGEQPLSSDVHQVTQITDTLKIARALRPGQRNGLSSLCKHYGISLAQRELHGALVDAGLLADVYLAMTRGQNSLSMTVQPSSVSMDTQFNGASIVVLHATEEELCAHQSYLERLPGHRW